MPPYPPPPHILQWQSQMNTLKKAVSTSFATMPLPPDQDKRRKELYSQMNSLQIQLASLATSQPAGAWIVRKLKILKYLYFVWPFKNT